MDSGVLELFDLDGGVDSHTNQGQLHRRSILNMDLRSTAFPWYEMYPKESSAPSPFAKGSGNLREDAAALPPARICLLDFMEQNGSLPNFGSTDNTSSESFASFLV
jgi:hypothetical protein